MSIFFFLEKTVYFDYSNVEITFFFFYYRVNSGNRKFKVSFLRIFYRGFIVSLNEIDGYKIDKKILGSFDLMI